GGFAPRTPQHALSRAASSARSVRVPRSRGSLGRLFVAASQPGTRNLRPRNLDGGFIMFRTAVLAGFVAVALSPLSSPTEQSRRVDLEAADCSSINMTMGEYET